MIEFDALLADPGAVGRIGCPVGQEANVDEFFFWVAPGSLIEQTQIVRVPTVMGGRDVEVYGVVEQVFRRSTISTMPARSTSVSPSAKRGCSWTAVPIP